MTIFPKNLSIANERFEFSSQLSDGAALPVLEFKGQSGDGYGIINNALWLQDMQDAYEGVLYTVPAGLSATNYLSLTHDGTNASMAIDKYSDMVFRMDGGAGANVNKFVFNTQVNHDPQLHFDSGNDGNMTWMEDENMFTFSKMVKLFKNTTAVTCGAVQEGSIYYDGTSKKHYGCDGTNWNAMY